MKIERLAPEPLTKLIHLYAGECFVWESAPRGDVKTSEIKHGFPIVVNLSSGLASTAAEEEKVRRIKAKVVIG